MFNYKPVLYIIGVFLNVLALMMLLPTALAFWDGENGTMQFFESAIITYAAALFCMTKGNRDLGRFKVRDMFLLTSMTWVFTSGFAALPLVFVEHISYTDAYFETMSGITTTGSTVLSGLDTLPRSILLWRSLLQWLGGVGFIVMGVAVLPFLGVGGMRLFRTESSEWTDKSAPRTATLARDILWVYLTLTGLCLLCYWLSGMGWFDAFNHAMTTISTGGYSTSDASMAHFGPASHWVGTLFMMAGGMPFLLLVNAVRKNQWNIWRDEQFRGYVLFLASVSLVLATWLWWHKGEPFLDALRMTSFNVVSVVTTTGYALTDYSMWGPFAVTAFLLLMFVGGCSGSTSGGIKIFRFQLAAGMLHLQLKQLIHPNAVFVQNYNRRPVSDDIIRSLVAFSFAFFLTVAFITLVLGLMGLDLVTSFTAAITSVTNVGPGLGDLIGPAGNFANLPDGAKWLLSLGMLLGRLEILTVVAVLTPAFWRQ
ncbi:TrkH family potassium uptake protein [Gallaecimonas xiamenensis]|uniref:Trk system potassium uptake protein n=1 Tax=Gallaecimonas xiamenensis 3-C-1 TaxID=745411 RepID=K2JBN5_9GAMM|nr:TrkH family potassium uptake protein [Gallaecimonas xiamenensis]EKE68049.1 potassium uptake protein TrkH [Gallaecimonas xiamenensis 3-C-1]